MVNEFSLKFDADSFYRDYIYALTFILEEVADDMVARLNGCPFEYANNTFRKEFIAQGEDMIMYHVGSPHWFAFIVNYGSGSKIYKDITSFDNGYTMNPYREANNMAISTWGTMPAQIPNWVEGDGMETVQKKGHGGINLEETYDRKNINKFQPHVPQLFLDKTMEWAKKQLARRVKQCWKSFPIERYLKGGGDN